MHGMNNKMKQLLAFMRQNPDQFPILDDKEVKNVKFLLGDGVIIDFGVEVGSIQPQKMKDLLQESFKTYSETTEDCFGASFQSLQIFEGKNIEKVLLQ